MSLKLSTGLRNKLLGKAAADGSLKTLLANSTLEIYSGSQPADADAAETGTKLVSIAPGSGCNFDDAAAGSLPKATAETWQNDAIATGTAGWFRLKENGDSGGASSTAVRLDGAVATSGAELNMSSTSITSGASITIDSFSITLPAS